MKTKHTPGPWEAQTVEMEEIKVKGPYVNVYAPGAILPVCPAIAGGPTQEEALANARLIAAAPALLAAIRTAVRHLECPDENKPDIVRLCLNECRAAIEKATK